MAKVIEVLDLRAEGTGCAFDVEPGADWQELLPDHQVVEIRDIEGLNAVDREWYRRVANNKEARPSAPVRDERYYRPR